MCAGSFSPSTQDELSYGDDVGILVFGSAIDEFR